MIYDDDSTLERVPDQRNVCLYTEFYNFGEFFGEQEIKITVVLLSMPFEEPQLALRKAIFVYRQKGMEDKDVDVTPTVCWRDLDFWKARVERKFKSIREKDWSDEAV